VAPPSDGVPFETDERRSRTGLSSSGYGFLAMLVRKTNRRRRASAIKGADVTYPCDITLRWLTECHEITRDDMDGAGKSKAVAR
jgi:hypothetical protein